jgi:uncharacterized protein (TIGR02145 family)
VVKTWGGATKTASGTTSTTNDDYTYQNPVPIVTSISPSSGHFIGGETFTITGSSLTGATAVKLGTINCRSFTVNSDTSITCLSAGQAVPTWASQTVSVNVTDANGTNTANTLFTYRYPNSSFTSGNTYTHILGTDIAFGSKFTVGGTNCASQLIISDTFAVCNSPAKSIGAQSLAVTSAPTYTADMQNWTGCSALATNDTVVLRDTRNNQYYRVRKLADGKCWMIDNMKLADYTLTSVDSNVSIDFIIPTNPVQGSSTHANGNCYPNAAINNPGAIDDTNRANGYYLTCNGTSTQSATNTGFAAYSDPAATTAAYYYNCRPGAVGIDPESLTGCGYLYNWFTATAGTGVYGTLADTTTNANAAAASICPSGWHLPKAGTGTNVGNEFATLNGAMNSGGSASITNSAVTRPNWRSNGSFVGSYSGYYSSGFGNQGNGGNYWSSSADSATGARSLGFDYYSVYPGNYASYKYYGVAVRCVF